MDRERWLRLSGLIDEGCALDAAARAAWLAELRQREPELAPRVERALGEADANEEASGTLPGFAQSLAAALGPERPAAPPDLAGTRLGAWRLLELIGTGGMGQVWRARRDDGLYQGEAAIKLLRGDLGSGALAARFARERALLARLHHPSIARLLDAGLADAAAGPAAGQAYLVLELASGETLNRHVREHARTLAARVRLLLRVAAAVAYAHAQLVVHRDLKPANVLVAPDGTPKLLDFGIAALLDEEDPAGSGELTRLAGRSLTLGYAAPEQLGDAPIGTPADVFSLGVMLYELASGTLPLGGRSGPRAAREQALLHGEPPRLAALLREAEADPGGPGRPVDAAAAVGDLEAIALKALRKDPAERYASVSAFIADLEAWLAHRPVSARRDHWRHNLRLWLRRHALAVAGVTAVVLSLGIGLATSLWQRERALQAARDSDEVTKYLEELLASASPESHGGNWPTVLQLLEKSRADLAQRFAESPETRLRVLQVLVRTYRALNRFDISIPLGRQLLDESRARYGAADLRTLQALLELTQAQHLQGQCDLAVAQLEPALPALRALPRAHLDHLTLPAVSLSTICHAHLGRLDEADRALAEEERLVRQLPADDPWHMGYLNHLQIVRNAQGRFRDALEAIRRTQPFWSSTAPEDQREILTMQRNFLVMQVRVAEYDRVEERFAELLRRIDGLMGPASAMGQSLLHELARYRADAGRFADALAQREANLARAQAAGVTAPGTLLPLRVQRLLARSAARAAPPATLLAEARQLLADAEPLLPRLGAQRVELWIAVARVALSQDDAALAAQALARLDADPGLRLAPGPNQDHLLAARKRQLDGELARLRGNFDTSARLLAERLAFTRRGGESRLVPIWSATLDLAYTQALQRAPEAAATLAAAAAARPAAVPPGHPLDAAAAYLAALQAGSDTDEAARALRAAQQRGGAEPQQPVDAGPLRGTLGGVLVF